MSGDLESLDLVPTPALVVDLDRLEANIERMQATCDRLGVSLRPHLKTHKCVEIARLQVEAGARGATVSTLEEARTFAAAGIDDLTWAFPVIPGRLDEVAELAASRRLRVVADSPHAVDALEALPSGIGRPLGVLIKVDCGYHRAGVDPTGDGLIALARRIEAAADLRFEGLLSHSGHAYHADDRTGVLAAAEEERAVMATAAARLRSAGIDVELVSVGSTPSMGVVETLAGVDEVRPGNYAFYDWTQVVLGSAKLTDCALTVLSSVVSSRADGDWSICDAGALSLSLDRGPSVDSAPTMGRVYRDAGYADGELEQELHLVSLSQEHGTLSQAREVGERLRILPNHSCLAAACFDRVWVSRGRRIVDRWTIHRGR